MCLPSSQGVNCLHFADEETEAAWKCSVDSWPHTCRQWRAGRGKPLGVRGLGESSYPTALNAGPGTLILLPER